MGFAKVNLSPGVEIDHTLKIQGLADVLAQAKNAYVLINVCVNQLNRAGLPEGYDVYILGWWHEVFDEEWFLSVYNNNSNSEFIILGDFNANGLEDLARVTFVRFLHWNYYIEDANPVKIDWTNKKYKISSLSRFITQYRFFVTAALLNRPDVILSWHNLERSYSSCEYIFRATGYPQRDKLLSKRDDLLDSIELDTVKIDPEAMYTNANTFAPYSQTLVNCINETKDIGWVENFGSTPGPYLTEKTWKPLLSGTALIFTGQYGIKTTLEQAGFIFDYPWNNNYDDIPGDLERLEEILHLIDYVCGMSFDEILQGIKHSCEYNQQHLVGKSLQDYIHNVNYKGLDKLKGILA